MIKQKITRYETHFKKTLSVFDSLIWLPFVLNGLWVAFIVIFHLNLLMIDLGGHLASGVFFSRGLYHSFNDQFFNGYIHGLFYPPLEDICLSTIYFVGHALFQISWITTYKIYLLLIGFFYLFSMWKLISSFKDPVARLFLTISLLYLFNIEKIDLLPLQGMSFIDLSLTGLTSQILSGVFLFLLLREVLFGQNKNKLIIFCSLTIASHIVNGMAAVLFLIIRWLVGPDRKKYTYALAMSGVLTSFFWLPMIVHHSFMTNSKIWYKFFFWEFLIVCGVASLLFYKKKTNRALLITSFLLLFSTNCLYVLNFMSNRLLSNFIPYFHYYRFSILGLIFLLVGLSWIRESNRFDHNNHWKIWRFLLPKKKTIIFLMMIQFISMLCTTDIKIYDFSLDSLENSDFDWSQSNDLSFKQYGRYFVMGRDRAVDHGLDAMLAIRSSDFRSTKGLFWESSRNQTLQSSYLATLFSAPTILEFFYFWDYSCEVQKCVFNSYIRTFNVRGVIGEPDGIFYAYSDEQKECYKDIYKNGTGHYHLKKKGNIRHNQNDYGIFDLVPDQGQTNIDYINVVEPISSDQVGLLRPFQEGKQIWQEQAIKKVFFSCLKDPIPMPLPTYWLDADSYDQFHRDTNLLALKDHDQEKIPKPPEMRKISNIHYVLEFPPSDQTRPYVIKLSYQPGMYFEDDNRRAVQSYNSYPNTIVLTKGGTIHLRFKKTLWMKLGYVFSCLGVIFCFSQYFVMSRKRKYMQA